MHRFVEAKTFGVGPVEHAAAESRHLLGPIDSGELDELRFSERLNLLEQCTEREADPRNNHRPAFNTAMTIDALLERSKLHDGVEVERFRRLHVAIDFDRPRTRLELASQFGGAVLIGGELVIIVVVRDVLKRRLLFVGAELTLAVLEFAGGGL